MVNKISQNLHTMNFWKEPKIRSLIISSLTINIFLWLYIIFNFLGVKDFVTLHYNIFSGVDAIGSWSRLFIPVLFGFLILIVNLSLAFHFYSQEEKKIVLILLDGSLLAQIILLLSVLLIIGF